MLCCIVHAIDCNRATARRKTTTTTTTNIEFIRNQKIITILTYKEWSYFWTLGGTTVSPNYILQIYKHSIHVGTGMERTETDTLSRVTCVMPFPNRITYFHIFDNEMFMFLSSSRFFFFSWVILRIAETHVFSFEQNVREKYIRWQCMRSPYKTKWNETKWKR